MRNPSSDLIVEISYIELLKLRFFVFFLHNVNDSVISLLIKKNIEASSIKFKSQKINRDDF